MVKERIGASERQMKRLLSRGFLKSERLNNGGYSIYSEEAVQRVLNRIDDGSIDMAVLEGRGDDHGPEGMEFGGADATHVFKLIREGVDFIEIQIRTQIHPYTLRAIKKEYDHFTESITIPNTILEQMNRVRLPGNFPLRNASDILDVMTAAAEDRMCPECRVHPCADQCIVCMKKRLAPIVAASAAPPPPPSPPSARSSDTRIQADAPETGTATAAA